MPAKKNVAKEKPEAQPEEKPVPEDGLQQCPKCGSKMKPHETGVEQGRYVRCTNDVCRIIKRAKKARVRAPKP